MNKPLIHVASEIIDYALDRESTCILVHCFLGISRSAAIVIYYLMVKFGYNYIDSYNIVKSNRPMVCPNMSFQMQLVYFSRHRDHYEVDNIKKIIRKCRKGKCNSVVLWKNVLSESAFV